MEYEIIREGKKRKSHGKAALIWALVLTCVALAVFVTLFAVERERSAAAEEEYRVATENVYRKSYYSLVYNVDGLDAALTKLAVAKSGAMRQEYLAEVTTYATAAAENISNLAEKEEDRSKIMKFINQAGDYARYLSEKIARGGELSATDKEHISEVSAVVRRVKAALADVSDEVERGEFVDFLNDEKSGFSAMIKSFENDDIDYPSMIYDGPFSDSMTEREPKALSGKVITSEEAQAFARSLLPHANISEISVKDGSKSVFETYDCELATDRGVAYVTLSKMGGFPVSMNAPREETGEVKLTSADAEAIAEGYAASIGLDSMKAVWASLYENVYFVNLAYEEQGVIIYPDLVKVKVDGARGEVVGMESLNYIFNHTARDIETPVVSERDAIAGVSEDISVENVRLVLVPTKGDSEKLAYEVYGTKGEEKYFVYVDAERGDEIKIMYVVDGERGLLLQ